MARYIKANPKVAQFLRLENDRNRVTDGNYLLWQADVQAFGRLTDLPQILEQIGGIALAAHEAREEQDGRVVRPLPVATDPRFIVEQVEAEAPGDGGDTVAVTEEPTGEAGTETDDATGNTDTAAEETTGEAGAAAEDGSAQTEGPADTTEDLADDANEVTNDETTI